MQELKRTIYELRQNIEELYEKVLMMEKKHTKEIYTLGMKLKIEKSSSSGKI